MSIDVKSSTKYYQTKSSSILKDLYTTTNWNLSQDYKSDSTYEHQSTEYTTLIE